MLDVVFGHASDPGKTRNKNEDAIGRFIPLSRQQARSHGFLFAVADGIGMELGEIASTTAISVLTREFEKAGSDAMLISLLPRLMQCANAAVHDRTLAPEFRGRKMATSVVACALRHDQAVVSHVGNSRCYLVRNGVARQITQEHSDVNEKTNTNVGPQSDDRKCDGRHRLIRALGPEMFVSPDTAALTIRPGDVLVLCSDGLRDEMNPKIAAIVSQNKPAAEIAQELVSRAVEIGGNENARAQVIRIRSVEQAGVHRGGYRVSS